MVCCVVMCCGVLSSAVFCSVEVGRLVLYCVGCVVLCGCVLCCVVLCCVVMSCHVS